MSITAKNKKKLIFFNFRSPYIVTKYADVGFLECLRYEMEPFGVKVLFLDHLSFILLGFK